MAKIKLNNNEYLISDSTLATPTADFIAHLGTVEGNGLKVIVNGVEYSVDSSKMSATITALETVFGNLSGGGNEPVMKAAGVYETGTDNMVASWDELLADGSIIVDNGVVSIGTKLPDNLPEKNEYGFYYGVPYSGVGGPTLTFYADGSIEMTYEGETNSFPAASAEYSEGSIYAGPFDISFEVLDDGYALNDGSMNFTLGSTYNIIGDLVLPNDGTVTTIPAGTFANSSNLTEVVVGSGTTVIDAGAFYGCYILTKVTIPDSVTYIGEQAFGGCENLQSITFDGTKDQWDAIYFGDEWHYGTGNYTLYCTDGSYEKPMNLSYSLNDDGQSYCVSGAGDYSNADTIVIPDTYNGLPVTSIGYYAFSGRSNLVNISIPDSINSIGNSAFKNCTGLTSIEIPDSVTVIDYDAFKNCNNLTEMTVPFVGNKKDGTSYTNFGCIFGASSYTNHKSYVPSSLKKVTVTGGDISSDAFSGCSNLTSIIVGGGVNTIGARSFKSCTNLTSIEIGNGITSLKGANFSGCTKLTSITIPESVTYIGDSICKDCTGLTSAVISANVTSIPYYAFSGCNNLTSITLNNSITSIGDEAFKNCYKLDGKVIPDNVTSIGQKAFQYCRGLTNLMLPDGVTTIGSSAFEDCDSLTNVKIPDSVTSIGSSAFSGCAISSVEIGSGVTTIPVYMFNYCKNLTEVIIPDSVTSINSYAFKYCTGLTNITIPDSVTEIGVSAFADCSSLTTINIPDGITVIGEGAFSGTAYYHNEDNWENDVLYLGKCLVKAKNTISGDYSIKDGTLVLSRLAFQGCSSLTSVVIPDGVTSVDSTFSGCSSLTSVVIPSSITMIDEYTFYECSTLVNVYYTGTQEQWNAISIGTLGNTPLTNATKHYNYVG